MFRIHPTFILSEFWTLKELTGRRNKLAGCQLNKFEKLYIKYVECVEVNGGLRSGVGKRESLI